MDKRFQQAQAYYDSDELDKAKYLCEILIADNPKFAAAIHLLGIIAFRKRQFIKAQNLLQKAVELVPNNPLYRNHLANCLYQQNNTDAAIKHYQQAISLDAKFAEGHNNLANLYYRQQQYQLALEHYQQATTIKPDYTHAWLNQGNCLLKTGHTNQAYKAYLQVREHTENPMLKLRALLGLANIDYQRENYQQAVDYCLELLEFAPQSADGRELLATSYLLLTKTDDAIKQYTLLLEMEPDKVQAQYNLGTLLLAKRNLPAARYHFAKVINIEPEHVQALANLGGVCLAEGDVAAAIAYYQRVLKIEPTNTAVQYTLSALTQTDIPKYAPAQYIQQLFDSYAEHYDQHVTKDLNYQTPTLIQQKLAKLYASDKLAKLRILDLGCGTGLAGIVLKPYAAKLVGVDLSSKMLTLAKAHHIYDQLIKDDLVNAMKASDDKYDLIVAADVLIYFGDLLPILQTIHAILAKPGIIIFTVEAYHGDQYQLAPTGRYRHSKKYLEKLAKQCQLKVISLERVVLRKQQQENVVGYLVVLSANSKGVTNE